MPYLLTSDSKRMLMRLTSGALLAFLICGMKGSVIAGMRVMVGQVDQVPVLDGSCDACYAASFPLCGFSLLGTMRPAEDRTEVRLVHDGKTLYGYVKCWQDDVAAYPVTTPVRGDPNIWRGNSVEFFFLTDAGMRYYSFGQFGSCNWIVANQDDANRWVNEKDPRSDVQAAASRGDGVWCVEFSIPLAEISGHSVRFNIGRNVPGKPISCWCPHDGNGWWNDQVEYADLALSNASVAGLAVPSFPPFDMGKDFAFAVSNGCAEVFRYEHVVPKPYVKVSPANLADGPLYLDGVAGNLARLTWFSKHNYPGGEKHDGGWVDVPLTIRFKVPAGVVVEGAKKVAAETGDGRSYDVFEQKVQKSYNLPHYLKTFFSCSLPVGSVGKIFYSTRFKDGGESERSFDFKVIDVGTATPPKRFVTGFYNLYVGSVEDAAVWAKSGVNTFAVRGYGEQAEKLARELVKNGYQVRHGDYFWPGAEPHQSRSYERWGVADSSAAALDINLKPIPLGSGYQLSPSYRGRCFREAVEREVAFQRKTGVDWCAFDLEGYIQRNGEAGDFHPETVVAFKRNWARLHPDVPAPEPTVFEREPVRHPEEHRIFVETKCELWGGFFRDMKAAIAAGTGRPVRFSEWSMNTIEGLEARNHSLRGADFFSAFDFIELDTYAGVDRDLRQLGRKIAWYRHSFPGVPLNVMLTPAPHRLGILDGPGTHYCTTAPVVPDENLCVFKESMTMGAKGIYVFHVNNVDLDFLRQFTQGVNLLNKVEDVVMEGKPLAVTSDFPDDAAIKDKFFGKDVIWYDQPRVFVRCISHGERMLVSISEYRELKTTTVRARLALRRRMRASDLETDERLGTFSPENPVLSVNLPPERRCRLVLLEAEN